MDGSQQPGHVVTTHDALRRLTQVTYDDMSTTNFTYDDGNRITEINDSNYGAIERAYDGLNRLTNETTPQGEVSYTYDAAGRRTSMTVTGQTSITYAYDNANRLTSVTKGTAVVSVSYDAVGRRTSVTYPNNVVATYVYDAGNHLTSVSFAHSGTPLGDLTYAYDAVGNRKAVGGSLGATVLPAAVTSATYDDANRLTAWGSATLAYDDAGNLTGDGTNSYSWNTRNQLATISGGASASFAYDAVGRRSERTVASVLTKYLYDGLNTVQEQDGSGPTANLITGLGIDETFVRTDASGTVGLLADALGSVVALTNSSGAIATQYTYGAFGEVSVSGTASANASQFTGRENDGTGLYAYRARYYSPALNRFIADDPSGFAGGINQAAYVGSNPMTWRDPLGLKPMNPQDPPPPGPPSGPPGMGPPPPTGPPPPSGPPPQRCSGGPGGGPGAVQATIIIDPGFGLGPALSAAYNPTTGEAFFGGGLGVSFGHSFSFGPLVGSNPSGVLPGLSLGFGFNSTFTTGLQGSVNGNGALGGNSFGIPGISGTLTYGFCF